jgi:hypothetical protein
MPSKRTPKKDEYNSNLSLNSGGINEAKIWKREDEPVPEAPIIPLIPPPRYMLVSKSKKYKLTLSHLVGKQSSDFKILRKSVLYNFHGAIKAYARDSMWYFTIEHSALRRRVIWIVESK